MSRLSNGISIYRTEDQNMIKWMYCRSMSNMKILVPTANVYASYYVETVVVVAAIELNLRTLSFECIEPKPNKSVRVRHGWHSFEILSLKLEMKKKKTKKNILSHLANQQICHLVTYLTNRMTEKKIFTYA